MLGSRAAAPGLFVALEQGDAELRTAAWKALRELAREDLPFTIEAWRELLFE